MILVTGHKGFLGSKLTPKLDGFVGIDLQDGENLLTRTLIKSYFGEPIDLIYHLAAQTSVENSWKDPLNDAQNLLMTMRLTLAYPDARIIFAQSAAAEEHSSPYGFSKWASGEYLKKFHKDYVICTFPNVYGGGKGVVDLFRGEGVVTIYGDGEQVRDFVHADDIIDGLLLAKDWPVGEYSMGSGIGTKINDLARHKVKKYAPARKEVRESILPNTTPNWHPTKNVMDYIK